MCLCAIRGVNNERKGQMRGGKEEEELIHITEAVNFSTPVNL